MLSAEQAGALGLPGPDPELARRYAEHITEVLVPQVAAYRRELHCRVPPELSYPVASALAGVGYHVTQLGGVGRKTGRLEIKWDAPGANKPRNSKVPPPPGSPVLLRPDSTVPNTWYHRLGILLGLVEADDYAPVRL